MTSKPIFVATHPRACSTAFERVFMTRHDTLQCVHEPFGEAYYFGPERLAERYENDPKARKESGYENSTYRSVFDHIVKENSEVRLLMLFFAFFALLLLFFSSRLVSISSLPLIQFFVITFRSPICIHASSRFPNFSLPQNFPLIGTTKTTYSTSRPIWICHYHDSRISDRFSFFNFPDSDSRISSSSHASVT
jgi:hypothetical protein